MKFGNIGIYKITNLVNSKVYIGKSIDIKRRVNQHKNLKINGCIYLDRAFIKYGKNAFNYETIVEIGYIKDHKLLLKLLNTLEQFFIKEFESNNPLKGYNLTSGGEGIFGYQFSIDSKNKISNWWHSRTSDQIIKLKMAHCTPEAILNHSKASKQNWINMSDETKERIRQGSINKEFSIEGLESLRYHGRLRKDKDSSETRFKKGSAFRGKRLTEEHKKAISSGNKGKSRRKHTEEWKEQQRIKITGIKRSKETIAKHKRENLLEETLFKMGSFTRGKKWYNNGLIQYPYFENQQPNGWVIGKLSKPL